MVTTGQLASFHLKTNNVGAWTIPHPKQKQTLPHTPAASTLSRLSRCRRGSVRNRDVSHRADPTAPGPKPWPTGGATKSGGKENSGETEGLETKKIIIT